MAEHAEFADLCREMGIVFIGPDGDVMRRLGDKICLETSGRAGAIPVVPWSGGPVETLAEPGIMPSAWAIRFLIKARQEAAARNSPGAIRPMNFRAPLRAPAPRAFKAFGDPRFSWSN